MKATDLLARVKALRDERGRMYDSDLQILLSEVVAHLEADEPPARCRYCRTGEGAACDCV